MLRKESESGKSMKNSVIIIWKYGIIEKNMEPWSKREVKKTFQAFKEKESR